MGFLERAYRLARGKVPALLAATLFRRLLGIRSYERAFLLELDLTKNLAPLQSKIPVQFGLLDLIELDEFARIDVFKRPAPLLKSLCEERRIFVARKRKKIVAGFHLETGTTSMYDWVVPLKDTEARARKVFTLPDYRGQNIMPALLLFLASYLRERGYRTLTALVESDNASSLKGYAKTGYRYAGSVGCIEKRRFKIFYCTSFRRCMQTRSFLHVEVSHADA